jgi:hypothetical protein
MFGNSWVAERLEAFQEGLISIELIWHAQSQMQYIYVLLLHVVNHVCCSIILWTIEFIILCNIVSLLQLISVKNIFVTTQIQSPLRVINPLKQNLSNRREFLRCRILVETRALLHQLRVPVKGKTILTSAPGSKNIMEMLSFVLLYLLCHSV